MPSGLQFVIEIATSCIVKHKLLETFHTDLLFAVLVLHDLEQDIVCNEVTNVCSIPCTERGFVVIVNWD